MWLGHDCDVTEATGPGVRTATVTVLFCDVVGSTERQSRLGDDANDEFRRRLFTELRAAVDAACGEVVKTIGDAMMAVFRTSALDAVTCAALMHRGVRSLDAEHPVHLRIGVSAGEAAQEDGDWFGTPVVEAARLEALASPEQTLVAEVVRVLVGNRGGFEFRGIGERVLKGLPIPISVCELVADESSALLAVAADRMDGRAEASRSYVDAVAATMPNALAVAAVPKLTGRDDEIEVLRAAWAHACLPSVERPRRVVMVSGEPGIGKTRLVAELAMSVRESGGHVHYGRCDEIGAAAFLPWITVLDALVAECPNELYASVRADAAELQRLCPQLTERLDLRPPPQSNLDGERARLLVAVERILVAASERVPTLIVVEDLHWADQSSLLLLARLASVDVAGRFLVVGTYRDTELEGAHPLSAMLADLRRARRVQRVSLRCLDRDATASLIALRSGAAPDTELRNAIFGETEGHPFFVEEVCAYLMETGCARVRDTSLVAAADLDLVGIPEGVRDLLGRRFQRLSTDAIDTLRVAAVMGSAFDIVVLEELLRPDRASVLDRVDEATRAGLVRERADEFGTYEFCHALVRNTLLDQISSVRRTRLHRQIADTIRHTRTELTDTDTDLLAYHYAEAAADGDVTLAAQFARRAAEQAIYRVAYDEANAYLDRGLEVSGLARGNQNVARAELLIARAELLSRIAGSYKAFARVAKEAVEIAHAANSATLFIDAVITYSRVASGPLDPAKIALISEALEQLGDADPPRQLELEAVAVWHRAVSGALLPDDERRARTLVERAHTIDNARVRLMALSALTSVLRGRPDLDERRRYAHEAIEIITHDGQDHYWLGGVYQRLLPLNLAVGNRSAFQHDIEMLLGVCHDLKLGRELFSQFGEIATTTNALISGRFAEAEERITSTRPFDADIAGILNIQLLWLRAEQGQPDKLEELLVGLEPFVDAYSVIRPMLAFGHARLNHNERASTLIHAACADGFAKLGRDYAWPVSLAMLTEATAIIEDHTYAERLRQELEPYRGQLVVFFDAALCLGATDRYIGMLDAVETRADHAIAALVAAYELEARYPAPPLMARTRYWHAKTLLTAHPDRRTETTRMLNECVEIADSFGMRDLADDAKALRAYQ